MDSVPEHIFKAPRSLSSYENFLRLLFFFFFAAHVGYKLFEIFAPESNFWFSVVKFCHILFLHEYCRKISVTTTNKKPEIQHPANLYAEVSASVS